jgi:acyl carrier protein
MAVTKDEVLEAVQGAIAGALGVDESDATPDATLMGDLGAESIDLLDVLYRIERRLKVKIQASDLAAHVQGGISDEEFGDDAGIITPVGLAQLHKVMPQIDPDALAGKLEAEKVMSLFTVQNLVDMVDQRVNAAA